MADTLGTASSRSRPPERPTAGVLSRRGFLVGLGGMALAAACGGGGGGSAASTTATTVPAPTAAGGGLNLVRFFGDDLVVAGRPHRVTVGVATDHLLTPGEAPATLRLAVTDADGATISGPTEVQMHARDLFRPYYPVTVEVPGAGTYRLVAPEEPGSPEAWFAAVDRSPVPWVGDPLPALATPTTADPRGVDPVCTREPPCPFHEVSLGDALAGGSPVALYVGTPRFCQTAICGPTLDLLIDAAGNHPGVTVIHVEVYTDLTAQTLTEPVTALGYTWEPSLLVAGGDGTVVARLDNIFDADELDATLALV